MWVKSRVLVFASVLLGFITSPVMAATFEVSRTFEIMYIDLESAGRFGNDFKVDLDEGQHQIVVRFNKLLRSGGDTQVFQSEPIVLDLYFEKDTYLTLKAPYISTQKQAQDNVKDPQFTIHDDVTGKEIDYQQQILSTKSGFQNTRDYVAEIERLTAKNTPDTAHSNSAPAPAPITMSENVALDMMQFWYNRSDEATRKEMRIWIADPLYKPTVANIQLEMSQFWFNKADQEAQKAFQKWLIN
ncbi:DUF2057 domain-containing protein [Marinomonas sp. M1K-6]|uniref:DUF2057 domain-containing protein n=1 Tax=Marinomonas profundi TaxID=2726122 RepID=A0A847RBA8_9GAMM|nr:DUF2057 domain-containing protein [Marinomonas profundi]NLQ18254.1 DUF2057 domain-containing protein [Marinomonas profundi]UDV03605.1 DUF2057 domain-containing protein [Marinomonas profundi]